MRFQPLIYSSDRTNTNDIPKRSYGLQRLFSWFPSGWPGLGLLLLRVAVGFTAVMQGGTFLTDRGNATLAGWAVGLLAIASGTSLLIGVLTPVAAVLVGLGATGIALSWFPMSLVNLCDTRLSIVFLIITTAAVLFLGPGAFSLDARMFGRREIIIPLAPRSQKS